MRKFKILFGLFLTVLALITGAGSNVLLAADAVVDATSSSGQHRDGDVAANNIVSETEGRATEDPNNNGEQMYLDAVQKKILEIKPMKCPVDQISSYANSINVDSFIYRYYSLGTRPMQTTVKTAVTAQTDGESVVLSVTDPGIFTADDTIRVLGIKAVTDHKGNKYDQTSSRTPDLQLCVCERDKTSQSPVVFATNGNTNTNNQPILLPAIPAGTKLIRMGKAAAEIDSQTGRFSNRPTSEIQFCQNFIMQVEQTHFDQIAAKQVDWNFSDIERNAAYDMRRGREESYLFGDQAYIQHSSNDNSGSWFCKGIWWMADKDIEVGHTETVDGVKKIVISDDDLVDIAADLLTGNDASGHAIIFAGSTFLSSLNKIKSDKFKLMQTVKQWDLEFQSWRTTFGEIRTIYHDLFDLNGMSDCAFAIEPEYMTKIIHKSWSRNLIDLDKIGVRNSEAAILRETSALILQYAKAHARMKLVSAA